MWGTETLRLQTETLRLQISASPPPRFSPYSLIHLLCTVNHLKLKNINKSA